MKIKIRLNNYQDRQEIETEIALEDYEELRKQLEQGNIKFLNLKDRIIRTSLIEEIELVEDPTPEEFQITAPEIERDKGETRKRVDELWYSLKRKGCFERFNTPDEYRDSNKAIEHIKRGLKQDNLDQE
jgi:hypothetical protein